MQCSKLTVHGGGVCGEDCKMKLSWTGGKREHLACPMQEHRICYFKRDTCLTNQCTWLEQSCVQLWKRILSKWLVDLHKASRHEWSLLFLVEMQSRYELTSPSHEEFWCLKTTKLQEICRRTREGCSTWDSLIWGYRKLRTAVKRHSDSPRLLALEQGCFSDLASCLALLLNPTPKHNSRLQAQTSSRCAFRPFSFAICFNFLSSFLLICLPPCTAVWLPFFCFFFFGIKINALEFCGCSCSGSSAWLQRKRNDEHQPLSVPLKQTTKGDCIHHEIMSFRDIAFAPAMEQTTPSHKRSVEAYRWWDTWRIDPC